jgi:predicted acetyltransferase
VDLVRPAAEHLDSYVDALRRGWSADNTRQLAAEDELREIEADPEVFLATMDDRRGSGPPITLPDGSTVPRLPGFRMWMWDGAFCGSIGLRWQPGTPDLPPYCLGHAGYSVVPWKRRRGYATLALGQLCPLARDIGLPYIELTTDADNVASQRVILANGGAMTERFDKPAVYGGQPAIRFRICLTH